MQNEKPYVEWVYTEPVRLEKRPVGWIMKTILGVICAVVVAAILFPVFAQSREGHHYSCISNVKQLGLGLRMYLEDYDGRFPQASTWMDTTYPYVKNRNVYRCPALEASTPHEFGYAFNASLALKTLDKHKAPEKLVVFYDANDLHWNANAPGRAGMANPPRHAGGNNVGFADGHAKLEKLLTGEP